MNRIMQMIISYVTSPAAIDYGMTQSFLVLHSVQWKSILKIISLFFIAQLFVWVLILVSDKIYDHYSKRRIKTHKLTIRNDGNMPSVLLLRTVDLPKTLAVRFMINGNPMIWLTYAPEKSKEEETETPVSEQQEPSKQTVAPSLVPNLSDPLSTGEKKKGFKPLETADEVVKSANKIGKKAGFFASIISSVSSLLPKKIDVLQDAQSSLKDIQQTSNTLIGEINTKVGTINRLGNQLGSLPMADKVTEAAKSAMPDKEALQNPVNLNVNFNKKKTTTPRLSNRSDSLIPREFVYDEETWTMNIGKTDENGASLILAQSQILNPGDEIKIDVEIMNLSDNSSAVSHLYKIEVIQVPHTKLHLSTMSRFINGIVIFDKMSQFELILPQVILVSLLVLGMQLLVGYSFLIF